MKSLKRNISEKNKGNKYTYNGYQTKNGTNKIISTKSNIIDLCA